jgi:hypothetical protein
MAERSRISIKAEVNPMGSLSFFDIARAGRFTAEPRIYAIINGEISPIAYFNIRYAARAAHAAQKRMAASLLKSMFFIFTGITAPPIHVTIILLCRGKRLISAVKKIFKKGARGA